MRKNLYLYKGIEKDELSEIIILKDLIKQNYHLAFKYYDIAANEGHQSAILNLGNLYYRGLGVEKIMMLPLNIIN